MALTVTLMQHSCCSDIHVRQRDIHTYLHISQVRTIAPDSKSIDEPEEALCWEYEEEPHECKGAVLPEGEESNR